MEIPPTNFNALHAAALPLARRRKNCLIRERAATANLPPLTSKLRRKKGCPPVQSARGVYNRATDPQSGGCSARRGVQLSERALFPREIELRPRVREPTAATGVRGPHHHPDRWALLAGSNGDAHGHRTVR